MEEEIEKNYTSEEVAQMLRVHMNSLYRFIQTGRIVPICKAGKNWLFSKKSIEDFFENERKRLVK